MIQPSETNPARMKDLHILLVEDNKINQFLAKTMLLKKGYKVELAADGDEALTLLRKGNFSMVITDVQMPVRHRGMLVEFSDRLRCPALLASLFHKNGS